MKLPHWFPKKEEITPHFLAAFLIVAMVASLVSLSNGETANADSNTDVVINSCSITQNGKNVKDDGSHTPLAIPGVGLDWKFNLTVTKMANYGNYVWNMYYDGVKQSAPLGTLTDLTTSKTDNSGSRFVENSDIDVPANVKKVTVVLTLNYSTTLGPNNTPHDQNLSCTTYFKDLSPDMDKSSILANAGTSTNGKSVLTVKILNSSGTPVPNVTVTPKKFSGPTGTPTFTPASANTDSSGVATFNVSVSYLGLDLYIAQVYYNSLYTNVTNKAGVTYALPTLGAPTNLQRVSDVVTGTDLATGKLLHDITLKWDAVPGATSYNFKYSTKSGGPYTLAANTPNTQITFPGVLPGTYWDIVTAVKGTQESKPSNELYLVANSVAPAGPLAKPANFTVAGIAAEPGTSNPTLYDVTLKWDAVAGAAGYNIKFSATSGGPYTTVPGASAGSWYTVATPTATFKGLQAGTVYDVVSAVAPSRAEGTNSDQLTVIIGAGTVGGAICGNNTCESSESASSCSADCGTPAAPPGTPTPPPPSPPSPPDDTSAGATCGNGACESGENANTCSMDCTSQSDPGNAGFGAGTGTDTGTGTGMGQTGAGLNDTSNAGGNTAGQGAQGEAAALNPAQDILSCRILKDTVILSQTTSSVIRCKLQPPAYVTARIIKGEYTPPNDPDAAAVTKTIVNNKQVNLQTFSYSWNGIDDYDETAPEGDYTFAVSARPDAGTAPDISIQKIKVMLNPPVQTQETAQGSQGTNKAAKAPSAPKAPPKPPEPSQCPSINYPNDIDGHWAKEFIRTGYDNCIFRGYDDGGFHPDTNISRGEAVKAVLAGAGVSPKLGCYDADCGSPFEDLIFWQGQWIRPAWDLKIVKGISDHLFIPQRPLTRGEAAVLIAKAFKIPPNKNCFTPNCGAGYPYNFFTDITDKTQGSYLRALWDKGIIQGTGPNSFNPNRSVTRAELAKLVIKTAEVLGKIQPSKPQPAPAPSQSEPQTQQQTQELLQQ